MNISTQHTTKYKNSPLGLIPENWEVKKIHEIGAVSSGGTPDTNNDEFWNGNINWCTPTDITRLQTRYLGNTIKKITEKGLKNSSAKILPVNSIIVCTRATIGKAAINLFPMSTNQGFKNIVPKNVNTEFLYYKIISAENGLLKIASGSTFLEVSKTDFDNFQISIPPLPEQTAIANCLSTWDKAIEKQNALIAQKELSKKALMQQLLSGKKRLKGFGDKWHLKSLEEVSTFRNGKAHENGIDEDGAYKVVNSKFVSTNGAVFKSTNDNLCPLFVNEIVMVMSDIPNGKALAKCFYVDENNKYTLNQRICSITANKDTNSNFLFYVLNRNVHYLSFDNGVGQTNLKKEEVLECPLLMPDFHEQTAIANVLQCADAELQLLKNKLANLKEQKKGLMQVLLTGKKRLKF